MKKQNLKHLSSLWLGLFTLCSVWLNTACSSDNDTPNPEVSESSPTVTLITSLAGSGDNGYNDQILSGVLRFYEDTSTKMSLQHPASVSEALTLVSQWIADTRDQEQSLLILGSDEYKELVANQNLSLNEGQQILVFECAEQGLPDRVSSFHINRYGASFLAGCMAHESPEALVVSATPESALLQSATAGFCEGYKYASGREAEVKYLADDYTGFSMPNEAYNLMMDRTECFVYPLAGGSNSGIYKYSREDVFNMLLIAGMDADCSDYSTRVPFSVVVNIDKVLYDTLSEWLATGQIPAHTDYGLATGGIEIKLNDSFVDRLMAFQDYYYDNAYWANEYQKYQSLAIEKEADYVEE
jgi:basic membrane protein A